MTRTAPITLRFGGCQPPASIHNQAAYVEALGGEVEIRAKFPNQEVQVKQFRDVEKLKAALAPRAKPKKTA